MNQIRSFFEREIIVDFKLDPEHEQVLDNLRRYLSREIAPVAVEHRTKQMDPAQCRKLLKDLRQFGFICGWIPEARGGLGLDMFTSGLMYEELARTFPDLAGTAFIAEASTLGMSELEQRDLRERYLPGMLEADIIGCGAITDPGAGSNPREMQTRAVKDGKGWRINGSKSWISNGGISDVCSVITKTGDNAFTTFIVDRKEHGYRTSEIHKVGLHAWSTSELFFDDVWVPDENVVGEPHMGMRTTLTTLERGRVLIALFATGICQAALDAAIDYSQNRVQYHVPIAGHQLVQEMIADIATLTETSRLLAYKALRRLSDGEPNKMQSAMAKQYATEAAVKAATIAMSVFGANGLAVEFPVESLLRNAKVLTIPDGTTQINKLIMGRELLGFSALKSAAVPTGK